MGRAGHMTLVAKRSLRAMTDRVKRLSGGLPDVRRAECGPRARLASYLETT